MEDLPDLLLERKVELCTEALQVLDVIEPGYSRIRGITLYELHAPLMILARHEYQNNFVDKEGFRKKLQKAVDMLGEAVTILRNEPESTPEGQLGLLAENAYKQLKENFDLLVETA